MKGFLRALKSQNIKMLKKKKGVALPYVIVVGTCLFILVTTLFAVSVSDNVVFSERYNQRQAYITAKSVIEYSKAVLTDDMSSESKSEPTSFIVTANKENGRITSYSYDNNASYSAFSTEQLEQRVKINNAIGYCYVKKSLTEQDTYEITIKAIVDYKGAGGSTKTEVLTYQGLRCIYTPGEIKPGNSWNPPEMDNSFDGTFDFNFQAGQIQYIWTGTEMLQLFGSPNWYLNGQGTTAQKWIDSKTDYNRANVWSSDYYMHLETATEFVNQHQADTFATVILGGVNSAIYSYLGTLGVSTFDLPGGLQIHQTASETYMNGNVASLGFRVEINSMLDMKLTNWCRFEDGIHVRSIYGSANSANVTITGNNHATTGEKGTFAVFEGKDTVNNSDSKYSIVLSQSGTLKVSSFDYIIARKNSSGLGGGVFLAQSTQNQNSGNVLEMQSKKAVVIDNDVKCESNSSYSKVEIKAEGEGAYVAIGGTVTSSGAPVVISAIDSTKPKGYGPVYCNYNANSTENGVPVYKSGNIKIYNPTKLGSITDILNSIDFPDFSRIDGKLVVPEPAPTGESTPATKTFEGGTYN